MGQMRFRDPSSNKVKFIADDNGDLYAVGKDGQVTDRIIVSDPPEGAQFEPVEIKPEDFRGATNAPPPPPPESK